MSDQETASFWASEAVKHLLTYGGVATGLFGAAGWLIWNEQAACTRESLSRGVACTKQLDLLGVLTFTSAGELGGFLAFATLVVCGIWLLVLSLSRGS